MNHNKQKPKTFCTTREAAHLLSVSLRTAQLWVESGLLEAWKTEGGHRRISRTSVDQLLANPTRARLISASEQNFSIPSEQPAPSMNVLVVEDDPNLQRLYEIKLSNWNLPIKVHLATDGYEAMILIGNIRPDLLILDLQIPGIDGFRLLKTLKNMNEFNRIKIVVVSGLDAEEIALRGGVPNDILVLAKPVPFDKLQAIAMELTDLASLQYQTGSL